MAVIFVSNSGGLWSSPSTWVGGVLPLYPDSIGFTATSGNLDVDVNETILGINFTNYVGTFRMLAGLTGLSIVDDGAGTAGFINMGSGGYTLIDDGTVWGISVSGTPSPILTNTVGKVNPIKMLLNSVVINGNWIQQGIIDDAGSLQSFDIQNGTFTILGNQSFNFGVYATGNASASLVFNGNINITDLQIDGGTYKVIGGTFNCNTVFIENILTNTIIDFNGNSFVSATISGTSANSIKLDSVFLSGDLNITSSSVVNLIGNFGFNVNTIFSNYFNPSTIKFKSTVEYFINTQIDITNTILLSSTSGVKAKLTLGQNINQLRVVNINATDIDSSNGKRVNNFYGTSTNCDNWRIWNDNTLPQAPSTF